jgi:hypothetical protein
MPIEVSERVRAVKWSAPDDAVSPSPKKNCALTPPASGTTPVENPSTMDHNVQNCRLWFDANDETADNLLAIYYLINLLS